MSPIDWAASLDTSFTAEDLADSPDLVIMTIQSKSAQLDNYKSQLALLQGAVDGDPATLKAAVESAARNLDKAEAALNSKYLDSTIELAKIIISIATDGASDAGGKLGEMQTELEGSVKKLDPMGTVEDIGKQISAVSGSLLRLYMPPIKSLPCFYRSVMHKGPSNRLQVCTRQSQPHSREPKRPILEPNKQVFSAPSML